MTQIHTTIGVYLNGSYKINGVAPEDLQDHIEYNRKYRFGRALFVDGVCVYNGYLNDEEVAKFAEKIKGSANYVMDRITRPYQ